MKTRVQKWGNSLAIRIPRAMAAEMQVANQSMVDVTLVGDRLIVKPLLDEGPSLDELLEGITDENVHEEADWGPAVGKESW